jgi:lipoate-protein ligase A
MRTDAPHSAALRNADLPNSIRLIIDPSARGAWNMSLDEALLHGVASSESPDTLRFYQWSEPTLSLGYFQGEAERKTHSASESCAVVRRSSGGGAILHHHELTYSLCLRTTGRFAASELYTAMHQSLITVLGKWGMEAELHREPVGSARSGSPFLCFQRRSSGDVVFRSDKICGSAQRRQGRAVLQHGSLLLRRSPCAPELPGIEELAQKRCLLAEIRQSWTTEVQERLGRTFSPDSSWNSEEIAVARLWEAERFGNPQWTFRR